MKIPFPKSFQEVNMMRKHQLLITIILWFPLITSKAQERIDLPLKTGKWKQEYVSCQIIENGNTWNQEFHRHYSEVYTTEETSINGNTYFIVWNTDFGTMGAIRQNANQVYYRPFLGNGYGDEILLYDFSVEDVFSITTQEGNHRTFNVLKIDTINIGGKNRKRIEFDDPEGWFIGKYWIEGIGSTGGLLKPFYSTPIPTCERCCGVVENLVCLTINDELAYLNEGYSDCNTLISATNDYKEFGDIDISVSRSNVLTINATNGHPLQLIQIFNQQGQRIFSQQTNHPNQFQMQLQIKGLCIVRAYTDNGNSSKKVLVK